MFCKTEMAVFMVSAWREMSHWSLQCDSQKALGAYEEDWFKLWGPALQLDFHLFVCKMFVRHSFNVHLTEVLGSSDFLLCGFTPKEKNVFPSQLLLCDCSVQDREGNP